VTCSAFGVYLTILSAASHTGIHSDHYKLATARFNFGSSNEQITTTLHLPSNVGLTTSHTGATSEFL
jgi:hypothetical protein